MGRIEVNEDFVRRILKKVSEEDLREVMKQTVFFSGYHRERINRRLSMIVRLVGDNEKSFWISVLVEGLMYPKRTSLPEWFFEKYAGEIEEIEEYRLLMRLGVVRRGRTPEKRERLLRYRREIERMRKMGVSFRRISRYLRERYGLEVSYRYIAVLFGDGKEREKESEKKEGI